MNNFELNVPEWLIQSRNLYSVVTNTNGDFIFANDLYKETFLEPTVDITTINFRQRISESESFVLQESLKRCNKHGSLGPAKMINRNRVRDTKKFKSIKWECNAHASSSGEASYILHVGHDVVAIEKAEVNEEHSERSLNRLFDDLQIGVVVQDADSTITLSNSKSEELLGLTKDQIHGRTVYDENWDIIKADETPFPADELPAAQAISRKENIREVVMGVFNPLQNRYVWLQVDANPEMDDSNEVVQVVTTFMDISQRRAMEEKARQQQMQLHTMMHNAPMAFYMKDIEGTYTFLNKKYSEFLGKNIQPGWTDYDVFNKEIADWRKAKDQDALEEHRIFKFEHKIEKQLFFETKFPIKDENGEVYAIGGFFQNITKEKEEEQLLRLQESVITNTRDAVLITEAEPIEGTGPKIIFANQAFYDISGFTKEEIIGNTPRMMQGPNTDRKELNRLKAALEQWQTCEVEVINYKKNGEEFWVNFTVVPVADKEGRYTHWISVQQDTTKRKQQEKVLKAALKEKTTLLAEIHHRVKNNLAIVSGLLELQSMKMDAEHKLPLQRSINRIQSIAMVHELMYQTEKLSSVNVKNYLDELIPAIQRTMQTKNDVEVDIELEDYELNINQAIPLGLLMNELLTNSFKYAFLKTFNGRIDIKMTAEGEFLKYTYKDNGPGFKDGRNFNNSPSLGLSLIHAQLEQLNAEFTVKTEGKFELSFKFPVRERGPHSNI